MKRSIISIDEKKCAGCGLCIPNCPEGAMQLIDGKARLVSDLFCDGLGACLGHCPQDAISVVEREAEPYDERKVMENILKQGPNVIRAHLEHLAGHNQSEYLNQALAVLGEKGLANPLAEKEVAMHDHHHGHHECPSAKSMDFGRQEPHHGEKHGESRSYLAHWPVQLHLVSPAQTQYQGADVLLCADCVAYAAGDFHERFLKGKALAIACPKLDDGQDVYEEKILALLDEAKINTLTVAIMEVPCCGGLLAIARAAAAKAKRKVPIKRVVVGIRGDVLEENWV